LAVPREIPAGVKGLVLGALINGGSPRVRAIVLTPTSNTSVSVIQVSAVEPHESPFIQTYREMLEEMYKAVGGDDGRFLVLALALQRDIVDATLDTVLSKMKAQDNQEMVRNLIQQFIELNKDEFKPRSN
jgi:hypothetical protein